MFRKAKNYYIKFPVQVKATFWITFCALFQKGISVVTMPIFTRILEPSDYGYYALYITWSNIFSIIATLGLNNGAFNTAMIKWEDKRSEIISSFWGLTTLNTCAIFTFIIALQHFTNFEILGFSNLLIVVMAVKITFSSAFNMWISRERFEYNYIPLAILTILYTILSTVISLIITIYAEDKGLARILSFEFVSIVIYAFCSCIILYKGKKLYNKKYWTYAIRINGPLTIHFLSGSLLNQADRIMINDFYGTSETGIYSIAYSIGMLIHIINTSINSSLIPWQYNNINNPKLKKQINNIILMLFSIVVIFILFVPEMLFVFAAPKYYLALNAIPIIIGSAFFIFISSLFTNIELYYEKSIYSTIATLLATIINIILNILLIRINYLFAAVTTLISYVLMAIFHYIVLKKILRDQKNSNEIYDYKFILIISLLVVIVSCLATLLYKMQVIRYLLILITLFLLFYKRKTIILLLRFGRK